MRTYAYAGLPVRHTGNRHYADSRPVPCFVGLGGYLEVSATSLMHASTHLGRETMKVSWERPII